LIGGGQDFIKLKTGQMENQLQTNNQKNQLVLGNKQSMSLCAAMEAGNNREITLILKQYKDEKGMVKYPEVFKIPSEDRLPIIAQKDFLKATALVVAALTMAFEKMSMSKKVDGALVNNIADEIIDICGEDNIAMEDLMLFLQGLVRGKYGNHDAMTVSKFMNLFDVYLEERWQAIVTYREEEYQKLEALGDPTDRIKGNTLLDEQLAAYSSKLQEKNDEIKLLKREMRDKK